MFSLPKEFCFMWYDLLVLCHLPLTNMHAGSFACQSNFSVSGRVNTNVVEMGLISSFSYGAQIEDIVKHLVEIKRWQCQIEHLCHTFDKSSRDCKCNGA